MSRYDVLLYVATGNKSIGAIFFALLFRSTMHTMMTIIISTMDITGGKKYFGTTRVAFLDHFLLSSLQGGTLSLGEPQSA